MIKAGNDISTLQQDMQNVYNDARNEIGYYSFRIRNGKYEHDYKTGNKYNLRGADYGGFSDLLGGMTNSNKVQDVITDLMPLSEKFFDKMVEELAHE